MKKIVLSIAIAFLAILISGCSLKSEYNRSYIEKELNATLQKRNDMDVIVYTTKADDDAVVVARPQSFTGGANTLEVQTGIIGREVTYEYFKQYFNNVIKTNKFDSQKNTMIVINPKISLFEYEMDSLSNLGFAITPKIHFLFSVTVSQNYKVVFSKTYDSGVVAGETYMMSASPYEKINQALHMSLFNLYKIISKDIAEAIK